ncbi:thioredoxin-1 [Cladorrhinum samala]|uniref:Thioredoxin n=1 Tax=Cladorrhinum samala TaxID=585594 RepID=A0AAV9I4Z0_9PEZI|nr:thioredoxin-1 [Cladorrhinum samala]
MTIHSVENQSQFKEVIASNKIVLVDCYAMWSTASKFVGPHIEKQLKESTWKDEVYFAKVDVDEQAEISEELGVSIVPTFFLFKDGQKVDSCPGANPIAILDMVKKHNK